MRRLHAMPLALAIALALVVKIALLVMLHKAFFAAPQAKHMRMPTATVEQHLLSAPPSPSASKAQP